MANRNNDRDGVKIAGTAKADTINNGGSNVTIDAGNGDDYVFNSGFGSQVTIDGGADNDLIVNYGESKVSINVNAGNDSIYSYGLQFHNRRGHG